jgi:multiple sugar transport system permease protein
MYSIGLLDTIWTFRVFPLVWLLTGGGPGRTTEVLATYTYRYAFVDFEFGRASAVAVILLFFTIIFTIFYLRGQYRRGQT